MDQMQKIEPQKLELDPVVRVLGKNEDYEPLRSAVDTAREIQAAARAESLEKNSQVVGTCRKHGDYTQEDCRRFGLFDQCPECHAEAARAEHAKLFRIMRAQESGIPERFARKGFADFNPPTAKAKTHKKIMGDYAQNFAEHALTGRSLVLCGGMGTGKTMLACAVGLHVATRLDKSVCYTTVYHLTRAIKDTYGSRCSEDSAVRTFTRPDLLIIDEVGVQFGSATEAMLLFEVLNDRYENLRPTIVISNVTPDELGQYLGDRVVDRLRENEGGVLVFDWQSWRK